VPELAPPVVAAALLFAVCGFGLTRLLLPGRLRAREALWVLPVGACAQGLTMTVLGFLGLPFKVSLGVTISAGVVLAVLALRRRPRNREHRGEVVWPLYAAVLVVAVALLPMFLQGYVSITGNGSDAHLAVGTAEFLQHSYPTELNVERPVDRMPPIWRSKFPIYYSLGAVATLSGYEPHLAFSALIAVMLALAATGFFLVARDLLGAGTATALSAMGLVALDRMVLHTGLHPYYNQTWGFFAFPFALVLAWAVFRPPEGGGEDAARQAQHVRAGGWALLALFVAICAFAYPLALPFPGIVLAVLWWLDRRRRREAGERVARLGDLYRGRRSLLWIVPLGVVLVVPLLGVVEKVESAARVVWPTHPLDFWGGDLAGFIPTHWFFAMDGDWAIPGMVAVALLALLCLARQPRPVAAALLAALAFGMLAAAYFRQRDIGWYFQFKLLAFAAPLALACAVAGAARLRLAAPVVIGALLLSAHDGARWELQGTGFQLGRPLMELRAFDRALPPGASIRLDMAAPKQLWAAYFLSGHPLCSQAPLLATNYPHVPISRKADYVVVDKDLREPFDAVGPPIMSNDAFRVYYLRADLPGPENCSQRSIEGIPGPSLV